MISFVAPLPASLDDHDRSAAKHSGGLCHGESHSPSKPTAAGEAPVETLVDALIHSAAQPTQHGITLLPEVDDGTPAHWSFAMLYQQAARRAAALRALGVGRGDRVLIVLPTCLDFLATFYGAQLAGAVPVPTAPPNALRLQSTLDRLRQVTNSAEARLCVTNRCIRPFLGRLAISCPSLLGIVAVEDLPSDATPISPEKIAPTDPAFFQYTSGSTGHPKGVVITHANALANSEAVGRALSVDSRDRLVSWLPLHHDMGLFSAAIFPICWNRPQALLTPLAFLRCPVRWLSAISRFKATISAGPNFAYAMCVKRIKAHERKGLDLSSCRALLNGAERVHWQTLRDFSETYRPHGLRPSALMPVYGLAEASLAAAFPTLGTDPRCLWLDREQLYRGRAIDAPPAEGLPLTSVGSAIPDHELSVVDESGSRLPNRVIGEVLVRGPSIMQGYFRNASASAKSLRRGWLHTGDLGFIDGGRLYITGRVKDLIILRGRNVCPEDVESAAEAMDGVRSGCTYAFAIEDPKMGTEQLIVAAEVRLERSEDRQALVKRIEHAVAEACAVQPADIVLAHPRSLPKTSSGKKQRSLCREMYLSGKLGRSAPGPRLALGLTYLTSRTGYLLAGLRRLAARMEGSGASDQPA